MSKNQQAMFVSFALISLARKFLQHGCQGGVSVGDGSGNGAGLPRWIRRQRRGLLRITFFNLRACLEEIYLEGGACLESRGGPFVTRLGQVKRRYERCRWRTGVPPIFCQPGDQGDRPTLPTRSNDETIFLMTT